jgi:hypothetical protein
LKLFPVYPDTASAHLILITEFLAQKRIPNVARLPKTGRHPFKPYSSDVWRPQKYQILSKIRLLFPHKMEG